MKLNTFRATVLASAVIIVPFAAAGLRASAGDPLVKDQHPVPDASPSLADLRAMTARFAPTEIGADLSALPHGDRRVLAKLVEASKIIDALFLRQVWAGNDAMLLDLVARPVARGRARGCTTS